jgi:hypothetical protein
MKRQTEKPSIWLKKKGYDLRIWNLNKPNDQSWIELSHNNKIIRQFLFPTIKVVSITNHFDLIINTELRRKNE